MCWRSWRGDSTPTPSPSSSPSGSRQAPDRLAGASRAAAGRAGRAGRSRPARGRGWSPAGPPGHRPDLAETGGNPLALIEIGRELADGGLDGDPFLPAPVPLSRPLEQRYLREVGQFPAASQSLLLAAAADPTGIPGCSSGPAGSLASPWRPPPRPRHASSSPFATPCVSAIR